MVIHLCLLRLIAAEITRAGSVGTTTTSGRAPSACLPYDVAGVLVGAQAKVARVAQLAVARPLGEPDLHHQLRSHPAGAVLAHQTPGERGRLLLDGRQQTVQAAQGGFVEAGADLAGVDEVASVVVAEQQRAQLDSAALGA